MTPSSLRSTALRRVSETEWPITAPDVDIRDRKVMDIAGEELGTVTDLLVDIREHRVQFIEVASGGFLGLGQTTFLLPVAAIVRIMDDTIYVTPTQQQVQQAPRYEPTMRQREDSALGHYADLHRHYNYPPYGELRAL
ncbi:MAG: PRC-barrel domain-containing protein [Candidatus Tectimicrobiota bacterium]